MPELKRALGLTDTTMVSIGAILGSGIFLVPATIASTVPSPLLILFLWLVGGVVSIFGALSVAELGAAMPRSGGQYVYLTRAYGPVWGFLYGWSSFSVINTAAIAAVGVAFAEYFGYFLHLERVGIQGVALLSIMILTVINVAGIKVGVWTQNLLTLTKVALFGGVVLLGLFLPGGDPNHFFRTSSEPWSLSSAGIALIAILWTYDAWIEVSYIGGEIKNPGKIIPRASLLSVVIITIIYVIANGVFISALSMEDMAASTLVASDAAEVFLGPAGATIIAFAMLLCTLGANNANVLTSARITFAMAKQGLFFRSVSRVSEQTETPATALILQGIWASFLTLTGSFTQLITYMIFASWIFYGMSAGAVFILRRKEPKMNRPYRVWGYPWVPAIFILFALWLTLNTILEAPRDAAIGAALILTGLPFYFYWSSRN
ncbi:MAG: amino acid permease [Candidatus Neomarinimicrobiota bacterium]|nr:amino acid permease [Candidatus Neomarinimicrobiota bacterium]